MEAAAATGTFAEFKSSFYSRVKDPFVFDCGDFNLIKVVLEGLKVNYVSRGITTSLFKNKIITISYYWYKSGKRREKQKEKKKNAHRLFVDADRKAATASGCRSYYFSEVLKNFKDETFLHVVNTEGKNCSFPSDILFSEIKNEYGYGPLNTKKRKIISDITDTFKRVKHLGIFNENELMNIRVAFKLFIDKFLLWSALLEQYAIKQCFLICHYHNEGLIAALRFHKIKSFELQHGIISREDIFYCMPPVIGKVRENALFADKMLVWGQYWKNKLLRGHEYTGDQILIAGKYFLFNNCIEQARQDLIAKSVKGKDKVILLTSQTFLHEHFIRYIDFLKTKIREQQLNWFVILKVHPSEDKSIYKTIEGTDIMVLDDNLHFLFTQCHVHISIYSTTLFESLAYGITNYSLMEESCLGYVNELIKDGISLPLKFDQLPDDFSSKKKDTEQFYAEPDLKILSGDGIY